MNLLLKTALAAIAILGCTRAALAQPVTSGMVPPRRVTDARGVDLVSGDLPINIPLVSFGENATTLSASFEILATKISAPPGNFMLYAGGALAAGLRPQAQTMGADGSPDEFGPFENIIFPNGAGFALSPGQYSWSYHTNLDGSRYTHSFGTTHFTRFQSSDPNLVGVYDAAGDRGIPAQQQVGAYDLLDRIVMANGEEWRFYRQVITVPCTFTPPAVCQTPTWPLARLRFVTSSRGYGIQFLYMSDTTPASNVSSGNWIAPRRITGYNKASVYCDESALQECAAVSSLPSADVSYNSAAATATIRQPGAADGVEITFSTGWQIPSSMRHTAVPNSTVTFQYGSDNVSQLYVSRIADSDGQWNYSRLTYVDDSGHIPYMTASSTNPAGSAVGIFGYGIFGTIQTFTDELGRSYYYSDGYPFRDWGRSEPESDENLIDRDERNNVTAITRYPKPNTGLPPLTLYTATFPVDCTNPRTCNYPITATDANGNGWSYTYAPEHGGVLTETGPLTPTRQADGSMANVRPQKRYEYAQRYAWIANGSGGYMHGPTAIWLLTRERRCNATAAAGAGCAGGAADEVVTDYDYGPDSGPNTLILRGIAVTAYVAGAPATLRTCYGYDAAGNRISETQPRAGLGSCP
ncbi:MAG TPA: hypothetical protein VK614_12335 [Allosphingosinicella sp.]|nr:hypothetical protein [Allosphingosinicella sp.]